MKASQKKRNPWLYLVLVVMVLALLGFTTVPIIGSFIGEKASANTGDISSDNQQELELQAKGYQLVLEREPDNQTALRGLIDIRLQQQDIKGTIEPLEKLTELNPNLAEYGILLAQTKQQLKDYEGAAAAYNSILDNNPGNILALQGMVELFLERDLPEKAISFLKDTLKNAKEANLARPDTVDITGVELLLARIYTERQRYDEAIAIYDEAIRADENDFRPVLSKALVLQQQGLDEEAKPLFIQAVSLAPEYKDQIVKMAGQPLEESQKPQPEEKETATED